MGHILLIADHCCICNGWCSNRVRPSIESFDLALFFPANLSAVLTRTAEAFSVPLAGMLNMMLFFSSILASTTYISGPGGAQIEPLIAYFLNYGDSGINKTGLSKILEYLLLEVTTVLPWRTVLNSSSSYSMDQTPCSMEQNLFLKYMFI